VKLQPTKTWLKEHKPCPYFKENCRQVIDVFDNLAQGWCVGLNPDAPNLDIVNFCIGFPSSWGKKAKINLRHHQITAIEAIDVGSCLHIAVSEIFRLNPDYRKQARVMRQRRTRQFKNHEK